MIIISIVKLMCNIFFHKILTFCIFFIFTYLLIDYVYICSVFFLCKNLTRFFSFDSCTLFLRLAKYHQLTNKKIFHAFLFNIRKYLLDDRNIQRRKVKLDVILLRVNKFDIKQRMAGNICFISQPQFQTKSR